MVPTTIGASNAEEDSKLNSEPVHDSLVNVKSEVSFFLIMLFLYLFFFKLELVTNGVESV